MLRITKHLRCEICDDRLGKYQVLALKDETIWQLQPIRLPRGMAHIVQPEETRRPVLHAGVVSPGGGGAVLGLRDPSLPMAGPTRS
jgi:hypothetical protein